MAMLSQVELNSIREMVTCHKTSSAKLADFAGRVTDPQLKQMFQKASTDAATAATNLLKML